MESQKLDIVELIEQNPITKLSQNYQGKFIKKIQENFNDTQQRLFLASFYCYLNYNSKTDFVIEMGGIWKWLGFSRKEHCKVVLEKHFTQDVDYKIFTKETNIEIFAQQVGGPKNNTNELTEETILPKLRENKITKETRGRKTEKILMTIHTFKKLCLKSCTKKADEIHDYFIKLEELTQETTTEESNELRLQLQNQKNQFIKDKQQILLDSYHLKCIVYLIKIKQNINGLFLYKFGNTDNINRRFNEHQREIGENIELIFCIESKNNTMLENKLKQYLTTTDFRKEQVINNKNQTELIEIEDINIIQDVLIKVNKNINEDLEILKTKQYILELQIELEKLKQNNIENNIENHIENHIEENEEENDQEENEEKLDENNINRLPCNTLEELNIKQLQLEKLKKQREDANKRMRKYRNSEKYKQFLQSVEYKEKERQRYQVRKQSEEFKKYKKEYYENNKVRIYAKKLEIKRRKSKSTLAKTDNEKNKFNEWLKLNIKQETNGKLQWKELINKYIAPENLVGPKISSIYKQYFIEYYQELYPNIIVKYVQYKINNKSCNGFKHFSLI